MSDQNPGQPYGGQPSDQPYGSQPPAGGQQPYQQPYAQQPYGGQYGGGYPTAPKTNTMAIVSLISSILGFTAVPILGSIVGIITGHMAVRQIRETGEGGAGLAKAGLIIGYITIVLAILAVIALVAFVSVLPWDQVTTTY
ncbi:DUF4190 domain-containing protein [Actinotalea sp. Marseille-Q4924]|uniref:DUF4190 domain-containing protein n=1 Tax=Actinotalea sp. Marseille-Q4924 TaxID=2866571 RepID=UPI001CE4614F|nr:DUF4190 domain-containing protein [Actinotalea sp. Marseille-Q4924]